MIIIRQGTKEDCPTALAVLQTAFAELKGRIQPESAVWQETIGSLQTKLDTYTLFLATTEETAVGCIFCEPRDQQIYFGRLAVVPAWRGQGIAAQLIHHVEQFGRSQGCTHALLGVRIALPGNIRLFKSVGYQIQATESHPGFEHPTYYSMTKELG